MKDTKKNKFLPQIMMPGMLLFLLFYLSKYWQDILSWLGVHVILPVQQMMTYTLGISIWLVLASLVNKLVDILIWEGLIEQRLTKKVPKLMKDLVKVLIYFVAVLGIMGLVFQKSVTGLLTASGILGLVVGLAIKNVIADIFSGVALNLDKSFNMGDLVMLHGLNLNMIVTVKEITWRTTRFESDHGSILVLPNSQLCMMPITNLSINTQGNFDMYIHLDSTVPVDRALTILEAALKSANLVLSAPEPKVVIKKIEDGMITYRLTYWLELAKTSPNKAKHNLTINILEHLHNAGIPLAMPKQVVYHQKLAVADHRIPPPPEVFMQRLELFAELDDPELKLMVDNVKISRRKRGEVIVRIDDPGDSIFILVEGLLRVSVAMGHDKALLDVAHVMTGEYFGEMSLLTGVPRSAQITAVTDVILYEIQKDAMSQLFQKRPALIEKISAVVAHRQNTNLERQNLNSLKVDELVSQSMVEQISAAIKHFFGFDKNR